MKHLRPWLFAVTITAGSTLTATAALVVGHSYTDMIAELGQPQGTVEMKDSVVYLYPAGSVTVADDKVIEVELKTAEELAREVELKAEQARQWEAHQKMVAEKLHQQGLDLKKSRMTDPVFLARSSGEQLAFWNSFQLNYPEIDVTEIIQPLAERYAVEQAELAKLALLQQQEEKIAKLEQRVADAEQRAEEAASQPAYSAYYGIDYPYYYPYYQPSRVVIVNGNRPYVYPYKKRQHHNGTLNINGSIGSVDFKYSNANNGFGPYYRNNTTTRSGITVINSGK